jgi:short-subunit dehydrogenase
MKPLALITGASSGIGAAFARRLARDGYRLILVARRKDRLEALAAEIGAAETMVADLEEPFDLQRVEDRIDAATDLELLINNAGFGIEGPFYERPVEGQERMHRLHVIATLRLAHAALRGMVPRAKGSVINVSSVAGFGQSAGSISYCATKSWMNNFTYGLYLELKSAGSPVQVQALCPGFTITEFQDVAGSDTKRIPPKLWKSAEFVVDASLKGLAQRKLYVIPGGIYKLVVVLQELLPRRLHVALSLRYSRHRMRQDRTAVSGGPA